MNKHLSPLPAAGLAALAGTGLAAFLDAPGSQLAGAGGLLCIALMLALDWRRRRLAERRWVALLSPSAAEPMRPGASLAGVPAGQGAAFDGLRRRLADFVAAIDRAAVGLTASNASLASASTRIVDQAERQAASVSDIERAGQSLGEQVGGIGESVRRLLGSAEDTCAQAGRGRALAQQTADRIRELDGDMNEVAANFQQVLGQSREVGSIVNIIQEIATQTNLLALNAAIEAARAGEQGRGFAVVADEVRKLAERTSRSTVEIGVMIENIVRSTQQVDTHLQRATTQLLSSVTTAVAAGESLGAIADQTRGTLDIVQGLSAAAGDQQRLAETIGDGVATLRQLAVDSAAAVRACNGQIRQMQGEIVGLRQQVAELPLARDAVDRIAGALEEMRANNILVMNSSSTDQARPSLERVAALDRTLLDALRELLDRRHPAAEAFAAIYQRYRSQRDLALARALKGDFAGVRAAIHDQVRPIFLELKDCALLPH